MEEEKRRRQRPWEDLPTLALVNIFRRTDMKDRIWRTPFVCKSWNHASHDPRVWSSIISDSISPEDVFVKGFCPFWNDYIHPFKGERKTDVFRISNLRTLIHRSRGGRTEETSSITSLSLFPFVSPIRHPFKYFTDDLLLRTIADSCPNLKHFSFHGSHNASLGTIIDFIRKCKKLELIDFSHSPYFNIPIIKQLGKSCPNLRGIRLAGRYDIPEPLAIRNNLPQLKILNLGRTSLKKEEISAIQFGSLEILYPDDPTSFNQRTYEQCYYCDYCRLIWGHINKPTKAFLTDMLFR